MAESTVMRPSLPVSLSQVPGPGGQKVNVAVRVRPFIEREIAVGARSNWLLQPNSLVHIDPDTQVPKPHNQEFLFDHVYGPNTQTEAVYQEVVAPIVEEAFNGFNGTVLCYGQTSSGKTHTLYGTDDEPGIIMFLAQDIQQRLEKQMTGRIVIRLNLIEIYNENVTDLLSSENPIQICENKGSVVPMGAEHIDILSGQDILQAAHRLQRERRIGETRMNKQSSRSHTILRITIDTIDEEEVVGLEDFPVEESEKEKSIVSAVLNFVDLAGSEKASQTGASGDRLREAGHINTSLSALSKVVNQLSKQWEQTIQRENAFSTSLCHSVESRVSKSKPSSFHVSYRDSKLTRILQSSLAGGALITIICNVTMASADETLSTLRFALSAKQIQTKPKRNLITDKVDKLKYETTIKELQAELFGQKEEVIRLRHALQMLERKAGNDLEYKLKEKEEADAERRKTFHFRTGTSNPWSSLSTIEDFNHHPILTADKALSEFREMSMLSKSPTRSTLTMAILPPPSVSTNEQECQTDDGTPIKKRKFCDAVNSTPISTVRMQRSLLAHDIDDQKKNWEDEKEFLQNENEQLRIDLKASLRDIKLSDDLVSELKTSLEKKDVELASFTSILGKSPTRSTLTMPVLPPPSVSKNEQQCQTDITSEDGTPIKKRKFCDAVNLTPISTVRMQRSLLAHDIDDQKKNWEDEKEFLQNENEQLRIDLKASSRDIKIFEDLVSELKTSLEKKDFELESSFTGKIQVIDSNNAKHVQETNELLEEISQLRNEIEKQKSDIDNQKKNWEQEKELLENDNQQLRVDLKASWRDIKISVSELKTSLEKKDVELASSFTSKIQEIDSNNAKHVQETNELLDEISQLRSEIEKQKSDIDDQKKNWEDEKVLKEFLKTENEQLRIDLKASWRNIKISEDLVSELKTSLEKKDVELASSFTSKIQEIDSNNAKHVQETNELLEEISQLRSEIEKQKSDIDDQKKNWEDEKELKEFLKNENEKLQVDLKASLRDIKIFEDLVSELKTSLEKKDDEMASFTSKIQEIDCNNAKHIQETKELLEEISRLRSEIEKHKSCIEDQKKNWENEKELLENDNQQLRVDLKASWRDIKISEDLISELKTSLEKKDVELASFTSKIQEIDSNNAKHIQETNELLEEISRLRSEIEKHKSCIEDQKKNWENEKELLENDNQQLRVDLKASWRDIKISEDLVSELKTSLEKKDVELASFTSKIQEIDSNNAKHIQETNELLGEISQLRSEIEKHKSAGEELKQKLLDAEADHKKLQELLNNAVNGTVNTKYTEKLKEDLKASWRDIKISEDLVSELKTSLEKKDVELASFTSKIQEIDSNNAKHIQETNELLEEISQLRSEIEKHKSCGEELKQKLLDAEVDHKKLKELLNNAANVRKPAKVNRGTQSEDDSNLTNKLMEYKKNIKILQRSMEQSEKKISTLIAEKKSATSKLEKEMSEKNNTIEALQNYASKFRQEKENVKERQVHTGIQCEYILELVERSKNGERVQLPPEFPDISKLQSELGHQKSRAFMIESVLAKCQCGANAERKRKLLTERVDPKELKDWKENSNPNSDCAPPKKKIVRMGSAMDRAKGSSLCGMKLTPSAIGRTTPASATTTTATSQTVDKDNDASSSTREREPVKLRRGRSSANSQPDVVMLSSDDETGEQGESNSLRRSSRLAKTKTSAPVPPPIVPVNKPSTLVVPKTTSTTTLASTSVPKAHTSTNTHEVLYKDDEAFEKRKKQFLGWISEKTESD